VVELPLGFCFWEVGVVLERSIDGCTWWFGRKVLNDLDLEGVVVLGFWR